MNYILVRFTDILMFIVSILVEDINWLRGYVMTLTNTECVLFFIILIVFTLLMKYAIVFVKWSLITLLVPFLRHIPIINWFIPTKLEENVKLDNLYYCRGYDEGYSEGVARAAARAAEDEYKPWYRKAWENFQEWIWLHS